MPLRETVHAHEDQKRHDVEDFGHDLLDTMGATPDEREEREPVPAR